MGAGARRGLGVAAAAAADLHVVLGGGVAGAGCGRIPADEDLGVSRRGLGVAHRAAHRRPRPPRAAEAGPALGPHPHVVGGAGRQIRDRARPRLRVERARTGAVAAGGLGVGGRASSVLHLVVPCREAGRRRRLCPPHGHLRAAVALHTHIGRPIRRLVPAHPHGEGVALPVGHLEAQTAREAVCVRRPHRSSHREGMSCPDGDGIALCVVPVDRLDAAAQPPRLAGAMAVARQAVDGVAALVDVVALDALGVDRAPEGIVVGEQVVPRLVNACAEGKVLGGVGTWQRQHLRSGVARGHQCVGGRTGGGEVSLDLGVRDPSCRHAIDHRRAHRPVAPADHVEFVVVLAGRAVAGPAEERVRPFQPVAQFVRRGVQLRDAEQRVGAQHGAVHVDAPLVGGERHVAVDGGAVVVGEQADDSAGAHGELAAVDSHEHAVARHVVVLGNRGNSVASSPRSPTARVVAAVRVLIDACVARVPRVLASQHAAGHKVDVVLVVGEPGEVLLHFAVEQVQRLIERVADVAVGDVAKPHFPRVVGAVALGDVGAVDERAGVVRRCRRSTVLGEVVPAQNDRDGIPRLRCPHPRPGAARPCPRPGTGPVRASAIGGTALNVAASPSVAAVCPSRRTHNHGTATARVCAASGASVNAGAVLSVVAAGPWRAAVADVDPLCLRTCRALVGTVQPSALPGRDPGLARRRRFCRHLCARARDACRAGGPADGTIRHAGGRADRLGDAGCSAMARSRQRTRARRFLDETTRFADRCELRHCCGQRSGHVGCPVAANGDCAVTAGQGGLFVAPPL